MILDINNIINQRRPFIILYGKESFSVTAERRQSFTCVRITGAYSHIFGLGERFDTMDQAGKTREIRVQEKFTEQGDLTYIPIPFFFTDTGVGIYIDTQRVSAFTFEGNIMIELPYEEQETLPDLHYFTGTPGEILQGMSALLGVSPLPPRWAFGPWISANRWDSQKIVESQMEITIAQQFPASVLVIEAWSDESTFYLWNDSQYQETSGEEPLQYSDLTFPDDAKWPSPAKMITKLHENGIRLILWQVPVLKKLEPGHSCLQHDRDIAFAVKNSYVVRNSDETPYAIPEGHWFSGSYVPDFTRAEARDWWFSKRRYLAQMGVDGFKTDGGEFIYQESIRFSDGRTGKEMINEYPALYTEAYFSNITPDQTLFSRAGYTRSRLSPIHWAGDQISTWDEMGHVLTAGLSAGLSGILFWSFDIAGFAGPMPDSELYCRSVQWAVFSPVMQWHSEPIGGQFSDCMASSEKNNDRSPWNIAAYYKKPELLDQLRFHFALRMNLLPSIYSYAIDSVETGYPMMRHLMLDYPGDRHIYDVSDEYIFGNLLIAPMLSPNEKVRSVYLPEGSWINLWTGEKAVGNATISVAAGEERIPVFLRSGKALLIDLDKGCEPGIWGKNGRSDVPSQEESLYLALGNESGTDIFHLDPERSIIVQWDADQIAVKVTGKSGQISKSTCMLRKETVPVEQNSLGIAIYPMTGLK